MARAELFNYGSVNVAGMTAEAKATPIAADTMFIVDSEDNGRLKESTVSALLGGISGITIGNQVANYAALPSPASSYDGELWYVQSGTGLSWSQRSGWFESIGGSWLRAGNQTFQVIDSEATMSDDADNTKKMDWELSSITTGNTRTITMADLDIDLGWLNQDVTTTASPTFDAITGTGAFSIEDTTQSTSETTGSIQTDGGLGVVKDVYVGGELFTGDDITITKAGTAILNLIDTTRGTAEMRAGNEFDFKWSKTTGSCIMDFEPKALDGTSDCQVRFGINSGTTGANRMVLYAPNGSDRQAEIRTGGTSYFCRQDGVFTVGDNSSKDSAKFSVHGNIVWTPTTSATVTDNGDFTIEATSNTSLTFYHRGTDGTLRSANLTMA